ncbi:MAG TPA: hypothetical protein DIC34_19845 [Treponema sp.]|nr:hypothetical protein [Treponema sp.]
MIFKCKMCGGDLDIQERSSVGTCQYCGTKQTLPKLDDDKRANLYERANHFRRQNDFDKASAVYDSILNEDRGDSEAYWSLVLCKYGVEYVEDPATRRRIPTCNRTQFASVLADEDYKQALAHADDNQRSLYVEEARIIDGIQKGILEISGKEEPFDVFICYKESDDNGRRTPDSVLALDMYHQLTAEGFKVFFARVTLEDKLGSAYEPYIFAALQSAKIMVVLGTKPEFFNAAWVKNEWGRYLALIKGGAKKTLIPAYRDIDPYALPDEFSHLQAQDMGKLGFMQDLVRGIKKILAPAQSQPVAAAAAPAAGGGTAALLQRAYLELEDGNWQKADGLLEQVLNAEPQNAKAYVGKAMAALQVKHAADLGSADSPLAQNGSFQKALRFGDDAYKAVLQGYLAASAEHMETNRKWTVYNEAVQVAKGLKEANKDSASLAAVAKACRDVAAKFRSIPGFSNADGWAVEMEGRAATAGKMAAEALKRERSSRLVKNLVKLAVAGAIVIAIALPASKYFAKMLAAANERKVETARQADEQKEQAEEHKRFEAAIAEAQKQEKAQEAMIKKEDEAKAAKEKKIKAAKEKVRAEKYPAAQALFAAGKYPEAMAAFKEIGGYEFGKFRWRILEVQGGKALLITEDVVEDRPFNVKDAKVTWETSTLRKYLNDEFLNKFSAAEQGRIIQTKVSNAAYGSIGGNVTKDMIFLLSLEEAAKYFKDFPAEMEPKKKGLSFKSSEESGRYFKENGDRIALDEKGFLSSWWLRSPGAVSKEAVISAYAARIETFRGAIAPRGDPVNFENGVRPALWLKL